MVRKLLIPYTTFEDIAVNKLKRKIGPEDNPEQHESISALTSQSQFYLQDRAV